MHSTEMNSCLLGYLSLCLSNDRYVELVFPIWHKTHFKMRYIYMALVFAWTFGIGLMGAYMIPTGKVSDFTYNTRVFHYFDKLAKDHPLLK